MVYNWYVLGPDEGPIRKPLEVGADRGPMRDYWGLLGLIAQAPLGRLFWNFGKRRQQFWLVPLTEGLPQVLLGPYHVLTKDCSGKGD